MSSTPKKAGTANPKTQIKYWGGGRELLDSRDVLTVLQEQRIHHKNQIEWHKEQLEQTEFLIKMYLEHFEEKEKETGLLDSDVAMRYNTHETVSNPDKGYWRRTALATIEKHDKLMRSTEIVDLSGTLLSDTDRKNALVYLSIALKELCEEGKLKRIPATGVKGYYYGLPYMFDGEQPIEKFSATRGH